MILYICEKPSQAKDIAKHLKATERRDGYLEGNGYQVTWCVGHLLALAPPEYYSPDLKPWRIEKLPVIPEKWEKQVIERTKKQFNLVKQLLKETKHLVIATDYDRAGECIAREILDYCHFKGKIERLCLSSLDDASIQKALKALKPGSETEKLYEAEKSREMADWLLGMNNTMAASSLYGVNSVLSIGRVQTPTLKLVVDRDRMIEDFKSQNYFVLKSLFESQSQEGFLAIWKAPKDYLNEQGYCVDKEIVEGVAAKIDEEPGVVQIFNETVKQQKAPLCFSLSSLQKKASSLFGYSAKQVLEIAQSLYESHKATSYPRTDCEYLPENQFVESSKIIGAILQADVSLQSLVSLCDLSFKSSIWNDKKISAHHAIIPTLNQQVDIGKMKKEEFNLYDLIRRQYLAQFMGDYEYSQRQVEINCAGEVFTATGILPRKSGWKQAFQHRGEMEQEEESVKLPKLTKHQTLLNKESMVESKKTNPLPRFTEGTLIEAMKMVGRLVEDEELKKILKESNGIGTEATRANILEILFKREYLQRKGKQVISTDKGRALIDLVPDIIKNPVLTAKWEQQLELIAQEKVRPEHFMEEQVGLLYEMLAQLQNGNTANKNVTLQLQSDTKNGKVYLCPACQAPLRRLKNKKGNYFWGCGKFPDCKFTTWEKANKPSL